MSGDDVKYKVGELVVVDPSFYSNQILEEGKFLFDDIFIVLDEKPSFSIQWGDAKTLKLYSQLEMKEVRFPVATLKKL